MWIEQDTEAFYQGGDGAIEARIAPVAGLDWQWQVGVHNNGRIEWTLVGATATRQEALNSAKAMISLMELALESGGSIPCG